LRDKRGINRRSVHAIVVPVLARAKIYLIQGQCQEHSRLVALWNAG
jgi:hypothetical protein